MNTTTREIITLLVKSDSSLGRAHQQRILQAIEDPISHVWISEGKASEILGISRTQLWRWRTNNIPGAEPFTFLTWHPPLNAGIKYDRAQVLAYVENCLQNSCTPRGTDPPPPEG